MISDVADIRFIDIYRIPYRQRKLTIINDYRQVLYTGVARFFSNQKDLVTIYFSEIVQRY